MSIFHYQKAIHKRKLSPGPFVRYQTYKKYLRKEFDATCVYCRMPDSLSEKNSYAVEHYRPKNDFPHLENEYSNLFYSCGNCNSYKGHFWPSDIEMSQGMFIPNPCDYVMHDHLRSQSEGTIKPHSFTGQWTIDLLDLNSPDRVTKRLAFLRIKKDVDNKIKLLEGQYTKLKTIEKAASPLDLIFVQQDIADVEKQLAELEETIKIFGV